MLIQSAETYVTWVLHRKDGQWDKPESTASTSKSEMLMSGLFGTYLSKRMRRDKDEDS